MDHCAIVCFRRDLRPADNPALRATIDGGHESIIPMVDAGMRELWAAGCGADAAPFFRIFNPVRQGQRFDAGGASEQTGIGASVRQRRHLIKKDPIQRGPESAFPSCFSAASALRVPGFPFAISWLIVVFPLRRAVPVAPNVGHQPLIVLSVICCTRRNHPGQCVSC